ncbi:MAG: excinuclease ABC subunit UvrA [Pirellulaceae bacterium]|jgi:excinuclease ABC subunit A|nr:excinuclease ABC subunit UvrA [Pirellulaceae bacterium]
MSATSVPVPAATGSPSAERVIRIRGARVHNLQGVDLDIPRDQLVVITGPSGSGKSSLALDTIFAEGQRQYMETLSVYARQFFHQWERPDVDLVEGLEPTICIDQRPGNQNPRSTVATVTEAYDYLRLLMARLGEVSCYACGARIEQQTPEQIVDRIMGLPAGTRTMILAPIVRGRRGAQKEALATIRKAGLVRARLNGTVMDLDQIRELPPRRVYHIEAIVDRIVVRDGLRPRVAESVALALDLGAGLVLASHLDASGRSERWHDLLLSTRHACPACGLSYAEVEPRTFSFNSPYGVCPACEGLGAREEFDPELVVPDPARSVACGAVAPWRTLPPAKLQKLVAQLQPCLTACRATPDTPWGELGADARARLWAGSPGHRRVPGIRTLLDKEYATTLSAPRQSELAAFRSRLTCAACQGARLRPEALSVRLGGRHLGQITALTVSAARDFLARLEFSATQRLIADPLRAEIARRLEFLEQVGVNYLTLDRPADTLSGGELQRVRLATSIGSGLIGVCYVLDEPSIGLHPRDNQRLIEALCQLRDQGNSVLVVEHDEALMRQADGLIDLGPGAGELGGRIVAAGTPQEVCDDPASLTGSYLAGRRSIPIPAVRRRPRKTHAIVIENVTTNNLKSVTASFPLQVFVCVTGVSGSGKSSLVNETLARAVIRKLGGVAPKPGPHGRLRGTQGIDQVVEIDQSPIGRTPRSNPATYTGVFDEIRKVFAATRDAKQRGFRSSRFSFNVTGGRCETCQGQGVTKLAMNFLPDLYVTCADCGGARFNRQTLQVRYRERSIADVLDLSVREALDFFANVAAITRLLTSLQSVGLGYLRLGQPSTTLSGGEAQRVKLATQLARVDSGRTLYLLDEPTTGLHFDDIRLLLDVLNQLIDRGNSVIVIEHHLDVIKSADWILDLGPEGGDEGGYLLAAGTPEDLAALPDNHTGCFLAPALGLDPRRS